MGRGITTTKILANLKKNPPPSVVMRPYSYPQPMIDVLARCAENRAVASLYRGDGVIHSVPPAQRQYQ